MCTIFVCAVFVCRQLEYYSQVYLCVSCIKWLVGVVEKQNSSATRRGRSLPAPRCPGGPFVPGSLYREGSLAGIDIPDTQGFAWHSTIVPRIKCLVGVV